MFEVLPSIDQALSYPGVRELLAAYPRERVAEWVRAAIAGLRDQLQKGAEFPLSGEGKVEPEIVAARVRSEAARELTPSLRRVVNATGVVIHTNLGRAPLPSCAISAMEEFLEAYCNLEFNLDEGRRGSRHSHLEPLIRALTRAEAGFVVNNNAAAVLVALNTLARGKEVLVSRGELIEIGGSFRMPDIIASGGALIREVGTTNKTRISDYETAITSETALLLKVHPSNYRIAGFTEEASLPELVELGRRTGLPVMIDLGSGLLYDLEAKGIPGEKPVRWYVEAGADVVTFSGDKLLGGPQAGFIVGKREVVEKIKKNPMVRALRVGKLTIASLQAVLSSYLFSPDPAREIPALSLLTQDENAIKRRARRVARELKKNLPSAKVEVFRDIAFAGGGSLPEVPLATWAVSIELPEFPPEEVSARFRRAPVPVAGRMKSGRFVLDCRTVLEQDLPALGEAARFLAGSGEEE